MKKLITKVQKVLSGWFPSKTTFAQWYYYIATNLEDKVAELEEEGTIDELATTIRPYVSPSYLDLLWETEVYPILKSNYSVNEYNQLLTKVADLFIERVLANYLKDYLTKKQES